MPIIYEGGSACDTFTAGASPADGDEVGTDAGATYCGGSRGHVFAQRGDVMACSGCGTSYLLVRIGRDWMDPSK